MSPIGNVLTKTITAVTKPDAFAPIVGLEAVVVTGRTAKAHKRGGKDESRERFIEEITGSVVWLGGVRFFNWLGDKIIAKFLKNGKGACADVGKDALRKPFDNFVNNKTLNPKNLSEKALSRIKFGKVATSVLLANAIIGFIVPPLNHKLTANLRKKETNNKNNQNNTTIKPVKSNFDNFIKRVTSKNSSNVQFKGGMNAFTNFVENTNVGKLISTDAGVLAGREINSRSKEERVEVLVRDGGSVYFYMFAQDHARALLNKAESGRWTRLDPSIVNITHENLSNMFTEPNSTMSVQEFKNRVYSTTTTNANIDSLFSKGEEVISLDKFKSVETNPTIIARAEKMSQLQPKQITTSVLSKEQVMDIYNPNQLNKPEFLKKCYEEYTNGASSNPNKFVPQKKLQKLRGRISDYVDDICKAAEKNGGKVDMKLLNKMKKKNLIFNGINFVAGFAFAALFLAKLIPTFQYWLTKKMTGVDAFPGTYEFDKNNNKQTNSTNKKK